MHKGKNLNIIHFIIILFAYYVSLTDPDSLINRDCGYGADQYQDLLLKENQLMY